MIDLSSVWVLLLLITKALTLPLDTNSTISTNSNNSSSKDQQFLAEHEKLLNDLKNITISEEDSKVAKASMQQQNRTFFDGDIIFSDAQKKLLSELQKNETLLGNSTIDPKCNSQNASTNLQQRNCLIDYRFRWPHNTVLYRMEGFHMYHVSLIEHAMYEISSKTCVKFEKAEPNAKAYVYINSFGGSGCYSSVGYTGTVQTVNLEMPWCMYLGTIIHELLHTVGLHHEQSSSHRDVYLHVYLQNVIAGMEYNFEKYPTTFVSDFGVGYDYDSIMHYDGKAFSKNGEDTLKPKDNNVQLEPVHLKYAMSHKDIQKILIMYQCSRSCISVKKSNNTK